MQTRTKTLIAIGLAATIGGAAIAGGSHAKHRGGGFDGRHGLGFLDKGSLATTALEVLESVDTNGDGTLSQAEIDQVRNDRHAAYDANRDGNLGLEEFAGLWNETTRPFTVRVFQMLDTDGDAVITRAEYDRPLARIVARLDRNGDGGLSLRDGRYGHYDDDRWDDDRWDDD